jgi:hypothetical protein
MKPSSVILGYGLLGGVAIVAALGFQAMQPRDTSREAVSVLASAVGQPPAGERPSVAEGSR